MAMPPVSGLSGMYGDDHKADNAEWRGYYRISITSWKVSNHAGLMPIQTFLET
jgi:hypothetical protein